MTNPETKTESPKQKVATATTPYLEEMRELHEGLKVARLAVKSMTKEDKDTVLAIMQELGVGGIAAAPGQASLVTEKVEASPAMIFGKAFMGQPISKEERKVVDTMANGQGYYRAGDGFLNGLGAIVGVDDVKRFFSTSGFNNKLASGTSFLARLGLGGFVGTIGYKAVQAWRGK